MPFTLPTQIAGIFEFLGAMVLGGETTKTIASDIANVNMFKVCAPLSDGNMIWLARHWLASKPSKFTLTLMHVLWDS